MNISSTYTAPLSAPGLQETVVPPASQRGDTAMADSFASYHASPQATADGAISSARCGWLPRANGTRLSGNESRMVSPPAAAENRATDAGLGTEENPALARTRPCQVHGVDEFLKVLAKWSKSDPAVGRLARQIYMDNRIDPDAAELLGRVVSEWKERGVFEPLMKRVMARYERDGTLAATVERVMAENPGKSRTEAEQEARALLQRWDPNPKAAAAKFELLLDPDSDIEETAGDDSD